MPIDLEEKEKYYGPGAPDPAPASDPSPEVELELPVYSLEDETAPESTAHRAPGIHGLSNAEFTDPNAISVSIHDKKAPMVVLFGPASCGKTMTLVRLSRFLRDTGYSVAPVRTFRPSADTHYENLCRSFNRMVANDLAAESTDQISFMLVDVYNHGKKICQILEVPGEHLLPQADLLAPYPTYIYNIINDTRVRKIWAFMVEPQWRDESDRRLYVDKIAALRPLMTPRDKALFILNKVDLTQLIDSSGHIAEGQAIKLVSDLYPGIFAPFINRNPVSKLWRKYDARFVPFQTGSYTTDANGKRHFIPGPQKYCVWLWEKIISLITG